MASSVSDDFWLFGYGLGEIEQMRTSVLRVEIFSSEDHRGTPQSPGRVVTLIQRSFWETLRDPQRSTEGDRVWGVAYHIIPDKVAEVRDYLDIREINGYSIQYTPFHPADQSHPDIKCLVYIGMPDNPQFLGPLTPEDIAQTINLSIGPSGENREYLLHLQDALGALSTHSHDEHIADLARRVRAMEPPSRLNTPLPTDNILKKINSTEEQEEIEKDE
ncbi:hypothetical protein LTR84_012490 [Exophiala bonariae]|uniref:glutathione-specific gamma-glutamylcyclotransferase n=1 Tax=Exophiala bonariae TaxID=1690606 RepID=A0AAV9NF65_9EURO|nr:hypothetical protein LTR84_012490 [Exophiala bonariae]